MQRTRLLLITGLPGSGKTTLGRCLAQRYGVPLLSKDLIKEPLLDVLGCSGEAAHSRLLSNASFAVLFAVTREILAANRDLVLEGNFRPGEHEGALAAISSLRLAQVLCRTEESIRLARLAMRNQVEARHAGHRDLDPTVVSQRSADAFLALPGERFAFDAGETAITAQIDAIDRWWQES
jgi:predicted kinase